MKWKIESKKKKDIKNKFLFIHRYSDGCLTAYWLMFYPFRWKGSWYSPQNCSDCGGMLWSSKSSARHYFNGKL